MKRDINKKKRDLVKFASQPIPRSELLSKMDIGTRTLDSVIRGMRMKGHVIWTINAGADEHLVWYKSGDEIKDTNPMAIHDLLKNDWYTSTEIAELLCLSTDHVASAISHISTQCNVRKRKNKYKRMEFTLLRDNKNE